MRHRIVNAVLPNYLLFINTTKKNPPPLKPSSNRCKSGFLTFSSDSTTVACSSIEKSLDERIHCFPSLLRVAIQVFSFMGKLQYHPNECPFFNIIQWLTILFYVLLLYNTRYFVIFYLVRKLCTILQTHPCLLPFFLYCPFRAGHASVSRRQRYPVQ